MILKEKGRVDSEEVLSKIDRNIIKLVVTEKWATEESPIVSVALPDGSRFEGLMYQKINYSTVFS